MTGSESLRRTYPEGSAFHEWTAVDGWKLRAFVWPAATDSPRGSILFQGGRGDIVEKYLELFHHWHDQGWSITSFDWRGQGGSGRLTEAGNCGHIEDFADYIADLRDFYAEWQAATPGPHIVVGHSMGGHLILRGLVEGAVTPDAAVLVAPMLGFHAIGGATSVPPGRITKSPTPPRAGSSCSPTIRTAMPTSCGGRSRIRRSAPAARAGNG
jgi:lysophospholipase